MGEELVWCAFLVFSFLVFIRMCAKGIFILGVVRMGRGMCRRENYALYTALPLMYNGLIKGAGAYPGRRYLWRL